MRLISSALHFRGTPLNSIVHAGKNNTFLSKIIHFTSFLLFLNVFFFVWYTMYNYMYEQLHAQIGLKIKIMCVN